ncbi:unnamed protein product, partial [marine sediment metagenome]
HGPIFKVYNDFYTDLAPEKSPKTGTPVKMLEWWSTLSKTGAIG